MTSAWVNLDILKDAVDNVDVTSDAVNAVESSEKDAVDTNIVKKVVKSETKIKANTKARKSAKSGCTNFGISFLLLPLVLLIQPTC